MQVWLGELCWLASSTCWSTGCSTRRCGKVSMAPCRPGVDVLPKGSDMVLRLNLESRANIVALW